MADPPRAATPGLAPGSAATMESRPPPGAPPRPGSDSTAKSAQAAVAGSPIRPRRPVFANKRDTRRPGLRRGDGGETHFPPPADTAARGSASSTPAGHNQSARPSPVPGSMQNRGADPAHRG